MVSKCPGSPGILGYGDPEAESGERNAGRIRRIERNIVQIKADADDAAVLERDAAIVGSKQTAPLSAGQPEARFVRRLLDVHDLKSCGPSAPPCRALIRASPQTVFGAGDERVAIGPDCLRIFVAKTVRPGRAAIPAHPNSS